MVYTYIINSHNHNTGGRLNNKMSQLQSYKNIQKKGKWNFHTCMHTSHQIGRNRLKYYLKNSKKKKIFS